MKKRIFLITALLLILLILGVYYIFIYTEKSLNEEVDTIMYEEIEPKGMVITTESIADKNLEKLVSKGIDHFYSRKPNEINITEVSNIEGGTFASFTLEQGSYYGVLYSVKNSQGEYHLEDIDISKADLEEAINVSHLLGDTNGDVKQKYRIISGKINDKVDSVVIFYPNSDYTVIELDDTQKTFMYVNVGYVEAPKKIIGNLNDEEVFSIVY
ncbi:hypothetical protein [Bacillus sp. SM2101]|uniref:hypothetical protein n=1 Tax=Bacillus sp. SM2101 TaxID=2805366 RepID=UPI001BDE86A9|nr:hypothetical protein [Bacillus sp. SM2101]